MMCGVKEVVPSRPFLASNQIPNDQTQGTSGAVCSSAFVGDWNSLLIGLRPTIGRYSQDGVTPIAHSRDTVGPMAQTVAAHMPSPHVIVPHCGHCDAHELHEHARTFWNDGWALHAGVGFCRQG